MKKLIAFSIMAVAAVAFAHTIGVPFFLDQDGANPFGTGDRIANTSTFIGLKNYTDEVKTCTVEYYTDAGDAAGGGEFSMTANQGLAWLPYADNAGFEGSGTAVPNSASPAGSAVIYYMGEAGDLGGRVLTAEPMGQSGYLMM